MAPSQDSISNRPSESPGISARVVGLFLGPLWLIATLLIGAPEGLPEAGWHCAGLAAMMATWWATEAIPIPATALLPLALGPLVGLVIYVFLRREL